MPLSRRNGWLRLGIVLSALWLLGVAIYASWEYQSMQSSLAHSALPSELPPSEWEVVGQQSFLTDCKLVQGQASCASRVANLASLALLPILAIWPMVLLLVCAFLWVRTGFRRDET